MRALLSVLVLAIVLAGCSGSGSGGASTSTSSSSSSTAPSTMSFTGVATAVAITAAPDSAPAGGKAVVCWTVSGTGRIPHTAIHWDNQSHAADPSRSFQSYDLGVSYPNNQTAAASDGYMLQPGGTRFCTAATMPASGEIYVVAHAIDSTGAPGRLSDERGIEAGSSSNPTVTIQGYEYSPSNITVRGGTTVSVHNMDSVTHTLTGPGFDTGDIAPGDTKTFVAPQVPGDYAFTCAYHSTMHGTLHVVGG